MDFETVTGVFRSPDGEPLTGNVWFTPTFLFARDSEIITLPATIIAPLDATGKVEVSLLVPGDKVEPSSWVWKACPVLSHDGAPVLWEGFTFELIAGSPVNLASVAPAPDATLGEYVTRGEQGPQGEPGPAPTQEELRPLIAEAVAPVLPSVARNYPPSGAFALESGYTLHLLSLEAPATVSLPATGTAGDAIIIDVRAGAEHLSLPGVTTPKGTDLELMVSAVYDGTGWSVAPTGVLSGEITELIKQWNTENPYSQISPDQKDHAVLGVIRNLLGLQNRNLDMLLTLDQLPDKYKEHFPWWTADYETYPPTMQVRDVDFLRTPRDYLRVFTGIAESLNLLRIGQSWLDTLGQMSEEILNSEYSAGYSIQTSPKMNPEWGDTEDTPIEDLSGITLTPGHKYEVVGLEEGKPRLRVTISPFSPSAIAKGDLYTPHPHAGETYEVPLSKMSP